MPSLLVSHHRPGFYLRVITEGSVQAGDEIVQTRTGPGQLSAGSAYFSAFHSRCRSMAE